MTAVAEGSPLDRLRARAEAKTAAAELYLPIPGKRWDGELVARITVVGPDAARALAERVAADAERGIDRDTTDRNADLVAQFTAGLYMRQPDSDKLDAIPGKLGIMRFDEEFAAAIGAAAVSPRAAVLEAFTEQAGDDLPVINVSALSGFCGTAAQWISDTSTEVEGAIVPGH